MNFLNEVVLVQNTQVAFQLHQENGNAFAILDTIQIIKEQIKIISPIVSILMNVRMEHLVQMGRIDLKTIGQGSTDATVITSI